MVIINTLFAWLVEAGYLAGDPLSLSRQRARRSKPRITRYLDRELWQEVKQYIDSLPKDTPRERERYLRARLVRPARHRRGDFLSVMFALAHIESDLLVRHVGSRHDCSLLVRRDQPS
jgi:hypothetical protein